MQLRCGPGDVPAVVEHGTRGDHEVRPGPPGQHLGPGMNIGDSEVRRCRRDQVPRAERVPGRAGQHRPGAKRLPGQRRAPHRDVQLSQRQRGPAGGRFLRRQVEVHAHVAPQRPSGARARGHNGHGRGRVEFLERDQLPHGGVVGARGQPGEQCGPAASPPRAGHRRLRQVHRGQLGARHDLREVLLGHGLVAIQHPQVPEQLPAGTQRHAPPRQHVGLGRGGGTDRATRPGQPEPGHDGPGRRVDLVLQDRAHPGPVDLPLGAPPDRPVPGVLDQHRVGQRRAELVDGRLHVPHARHRLSGGPVSLPFPTIVGNHRGKFRSGAEA
jgi:hypothetical protein